ncbi:hypothetical protein A3H10_00675 [Candidatus Uhrbacteria bacterium RIFCSPLOWO2_12_FULL_46_10]|uniref:DUF5666 domain-containing protein n=1 Tax=Candidatus Uhrbacteria bacterium RIFCSPLOWO2_01_FULL_47_25 TaxID=1802402 RepID=A0A1F7UWW4_9BACT|nr:MAG: hypothetical protein UX68_C0013G0012 [Parcubacteria group bacterium GW2011_GWA2_46_9]OGL60602.1 MAG: hypothetical protein A2752_02125 [Candidatus Uhrbacteria bacterium RIFCSPHIGHO2_01_FULL_46_23]OGL69960.1 MAG: hypothetical protein A3D60_02305 [Candidatus Uhrbacteria bacterium RIFCSPHIGHO2_02_FULL_47_29]OGL76465.1 MAG: hypothetical protein A3E96_00750 [Candidatus Uhrbacteria bacterium RIFCSPHIGHO2_12_FULL_46_13]OGL82127.1 MAG: hypothetical protein A2936_01020 [Candidatus Uhrbacteria bac
MNKILITGAVLIIIGGGAFYGGMRYAESKRPQGRGVGASQNLQNMSAEQRQQMIQQFRNGSPNGRRDVAGGEFINGEIIGKDDQSVTIKLRDGGSKIIFLSGSTNIGKTVEGSAGDLEVGKQVMVNGTANSDGSITAESIQIRSLLPVQGQ